MKEKCFICGVELENFGRHSYSAHKIHAETYYLTYYNKRDLYTGEPIPYKDKDQYFSTDFVKKSNLGAWLASVKTDVAMSYCRDVLLKRQSSKNLVWSPTQVELRTLMMPSIITYNKFFSDYYDLCSSLGFENKHELLDPFETLNIFCYPKNENIFIRVDTREQRNLKFDYPIQVGKLDFGDYTAEGTGNGIFVERKSLSDFIGTLSHGVDRFENEILRARSANAYLFIVVEESLRNAINFKDVPYINKQVRVSPSFIMHNVRALIQRYQHIQFVFVDGREKASRMVQTLLLSPVDLKKYDCQLLYDTKMLN